MWRSTEYEDLHRIPLPNDPADLDARSLLPDTQGTRDLLRENSRTWEDEGRIVAIVAVDPMWKGVGQVWTLLTWEARSRGVPLTRGVLRFINTLHQERGYWRLQATVEWGQDVAEKWIQQLGFEFEGKMIAYGPGGETHGLYARVRI